ncbi:MAG: hypothetical protein IT249_03560 [Chitinophagaceae bacterium]|nr:hypothetical protein [Chitinophagaceae bacterium]
MLKNHPQVLNHFKVNAKDRKYQFWERNPLSIELRTNTVYEQKLDYILLLLVRHIHITPNNGT